MLKEIINTITPPKKIQTTEYHKKGKFPIIDQSQSFICGFSDDESALMNKNKEDVVVFGDHTCILKLANFPFIQGADGIKIFESSNSEIVRTNFIYQYLNAFPINQKGYKRHYSELKEVIVCYSDSIIEQQKIAECLSSIDEEILALKEKVMQLKAHKKGLMQKLFPDAGKFLPKIRFPEFKNDGGWKEKELHEIAKHKTTKNKENCKYPVLTNSAIYGIVPQQDYFDRKIVTNDNLKNYQIVEYNDFVYNPRVSTESPVGPISRNKICMGIMSPLYTIFRFIEREVNYFECYFETDVWYEFIKKKANYGARFDRINISTDDFFSLPIQYPSPNEQQKIAECLSSIDELISLYESKVSLLEQHKKGLMQRLFPKL